jgi:hypothetical protein
MTHYITRDSDGTLLLHGYYPFLRERDGERDGEKEYFWDNEYGVMMWLGGCDVFLEVTLENIPKIADVILREVA